MAKIIGIDLGTKKSYVSVMEGGKPVVIPLRGHRTTPSVVAFDKKNDDWWAMSPTQAITTRKKNLPIKRFMGRPYEVEKEERDLLPLRAAAASQFGEGSDKSTHRRNFAYQR